MECPVQDVVSPPGRLGLLLDRRIGRATTRSWTACRFFITNHYPGAPEGEASGGKPATIAYANNIAKIKQLIHFNLRSRYI
ncbi:hypothetical protein AHiyo8_pI68640 (plasmid) [Arthrobacter sp. Hiyo8]|nr:hypothetical protein AHiyo8_pI68640 [Arthrobacter sp. Hiyo8]